MIILFFLILIVYFFLKSSLGDIKEQLKKNRCDSRYIFFSGWVSKKKNQTSLGATMENMTLCLNDLVYSVFLVFIEPLMTATRDMFEKNVMQIKTTSLNAAQASSLNILNVNLHVGMKLFRDHLTVLFIPIIKLNQIINDSLEKFVLILQLVIKSLEVHQLNIKYTLLSMYKALLKINIQLGNSSVDTIISGIILMIVGLAIFGPLFWIGFVLFIIGIIMYHTGFLSMSRKTEKLYKTIVELYPDVILNKAKHKKIGSYKYYRKKAEKRAGKFFTGLKLN